jgi:hypothetical protein
MFPSFPDFLMYLDTQEAALYVMTGTQNQNAFKIKVIEASKGEVKNLWEPPL